MRYLGILIHLGLLSIFLAGLHFVSGAAVRVVGPHLRAVGKQPDTTAGGRWKHLRGGLLFGACSGSTASGIVQLVSLGAPPSLWPLIGVSIGAGLLPGVITLLTTTVNVLEIALVIAAIAIPFRAGGSYASVHQGKIFTGIALMLVPLALIHVDALAPAFTRAPTATWVPVLPWLAGVAAAAVLRSSAGPFVLALTLWQGNWIQPEGAAMFIAGSFLGVSAIGFAAAREIGTGARGVALHHGLIGLTAAVLAVPLWFGLSLTGAPALAIALLPVSAHLLAAIVLLPLSSVVSPFLQRIAQRYPAGSTSEDGHLAVLAPTMPESLDANLIITGSAIAQMADQAYEMLMHVINGTQGEDSIREAGERILSLRSVVRTQEEEITRVLTASVQLPCSRQQAEAIRQQQRIAQELALVGDDCFKAMRLIERSVRKGYRFHQESDDELFGFTAQILDFLRYISQFLEGAIPRPEWEVAHEMEEAIDRARDRLRRRSRRVLEKQDDADVRGELAFIDIIRHLEHVGDRCLAIAEAVRTGGSTLSIDNTPIRYDN